MASGHGNGDRWGMDSTHTGEKRVHSHPFFTRAYRRVAANAAGLPFRCERGGVAVSMLMRRGCRFDVGVGAIPPR